MKIRTVVLLRSIEVFGQKGRRTLQRLSASEFHFGDLDAQMLVCRHTCPEERADAGPLPTICLPISSIAYIEMEDER